MAANNEADTKSKTSEDKDKQQNQREIEKEKKKEPTPMTPIEDIYAKRDSSPNEQTEQPLEGTPSQAAGLTDGVAVANEAEKDDRPEDDIEADAIADPQDNPDGEYAPPKKKKYKPFDNISVSNFQVIRLGLTPTCFQTYYQMAVDRLLRKSQGKIQRELEVNLLMRKVRSADQLSKSFS